MVLAQASPADAADLLDDAVRAAAAWVAPSIVRIETTAARASNGGVGGPTSGLVVGADGWIVASSFGLADRPAGIVILIPGESEATPGRRHAAQVVGTDHARNLTLLKVDATGLPVPTPVPRSEMRVGQWAIGLGRAWAPEAPSLAVGIVSALDRIWGRAIQTDAKTSPTNYGGPLVDMKGRVLGVIVPLSPQAADATAGAEWYDSGIGFAIPLVDILASLDRLKAGDLYPGLSGIRLAEEASLLSPPIIARSAPGSPAALAKLVPGDLVTDVNGEAVARIAEFRQAMGRKLAGDRAKLGLRRDGQPVTVELDLVAELPRYIRPYLGLLLASEPGPVTVRRVFASAPAANAALMPGDIIAAVNGRPLANAQEFEKALDAIGVGKEISLSVTRDQRALTVSVPVIQFPDEMELGEETDPAVVPQAGGKLEWTERRLADPLGRYAVLASAPVGENSPRPDADPLLLLLGAGAGDQEAWAAAARVQDLAVARLDPSLPGEWRPFDARRLEAAASDLFKARPAHRGHLILVASPEAAEFTEQFASTHPEWVRGLALVGRAGGHDNYPFDPAAKQAYLHVFDPSSSAAAGIRAETARLRKLGFPVVTREVPAGQWTTGANPLGPEVIEAIGHWAKWIGAL